MTGSPERQKGSYDRYSALHVLVLWNFAVAQPLYDLLSRNGEFFVAHRASTADLIFFILVLSVFMPGVLVAAELAAGLLHVRFRHLVHLTLVAGLAVCGFLPLLKRALEMSATPSVVAAAALGLIAAIRYGRLRPVRMALTAIAPAPVVFIAVFLLSPDIGAILRGNRVSTTPATTGRQPSNIYWLLAATR